MAEVLAQIALFLVAVPTCAWAGWNAMKLTLKGVEDEGAK